MRPIVAVATILAGLSSAANASYNNTDLEPLSTPSHPSLPAPVLLLPPTPPTSPPSPPPPPPDAPPPPLPPLAPGTTIVAHTPQQIKAAVEGYISHEQPPLTLALPPNHLFRLADGGWPTNGLLVSGGSVTLEGWGRGRATLDAQGAGRMFRVINGNLTLRNVELVNGRTSTEEAQGGTIWIDAARNKNVAVLLDRCAVSDSTAVSPGDEEKVP